MTNPREPRRPPLVPGLSHANRVRRPGGPVNMDMPPGLRALRARATQRAAGRSWYRIENHAGAATRVDLMDDIGIWGITAQEFVRDLNAINAASLDIHINSGGGDVFDGLAIFQAIKDHPARVTVQIDGLAASAASFIAQAGDEVIVAPKASVMIHDASGVTIGGSADHREMADLLDKMSDNIASIYADRAGGTVEDWRAVMQVETWYSAEEAVEAGLADRIAGKAPAEVEPITEPVGNAWASSFRYPDRDAAPAPKFPTASTEAPEAPLVPAEELAQPPAEASPPDASAPAVAPPTAIPVPVEPGTTDDAGAEPSAADEDTWGALVAQLTSTIAPLDPVGDALASLREAMQ